MPRAPIVYPLTASDRPESLLEELEAQLGAHPDLAPWSSAGLRSLPGQVTLYLDTFDERLRRAGVRLEARPEPEGARPRTRLTWLTPEGAPVRQARVETAGEAPWPPFARDLPAGPFREALEALTGVRRLLERVRVETDRTVLEIRDERGKGVARATLERAAALPPSELGIPRLRSPEPGGAGQDDDPAASTPRPLPPRLVLEPVRGFAAVHQALSQRVEALLDERRAPERHRPRRTAPGHGRIALRTPEAPTPDSFRTVQDPLLRALEGREEAGPPSPALPGGALGPDLPTAEALRLLLGRLLGVVESQWEGTRRDLDPEFLHDLRVAVRRTRSLLGQVQGVFPEGPLRELRDELAWLGRASGPTRDLDVHRLALEERLASSSAEEAAAFAPLLARLEALRRRRQEELAELLASERAGALLATWRRWATGAETAAEPADAVSGAPGAGDAPPDAQRPIREVADERIHRAWRRLLRRGRKIDDTTPAEALHRLRIDAKKLRYLLELFRELYEPAAEASASGAQASGAPALDTPLDRAVGTLKKLQTLLGDLNDLHVQGETLEALALGEEPGGKGEPAPLPGAASLPGATLLATGRLLERLEHRHGKLRGHFARRFERFDSKAGRRPFHELLKSRVRSPRTGEKAGKRAGKKGGDKDGKKDKGKGR